MPNATVRANVTSLPEETAFLALFALALILADVEPRLARARGVACAIDKALAETGSCDQASAIALNVIGAEGQLARARRLVADLQARRAEIAQTCATMRATLEQK